ncbi:YjcZ family sporulation protein [Paenibacillus sp. yr247]|nr:YjcZ family sporulation protein [Paenibacillus sp. yr247]
MGLGYGGSCAGYGVGSSAAAVLVLFILLVIITSAFVI